MSGRRLLIDAMVAQDEKYLAAFRCNAQFRATVEMIANVFPLVLNAALTSAEASAEHSARILSAILQSPYPVKEVTDA